jgi:hypothetical protein
MQIYSRTNNVMVYSKRQSCKEPTMILDQEVFVSGLVYESGDLFIYFEEAVGKGIKLFPVSSMIMIESAVSTYGMQNLVWGLTHFFARDCVELKDH